MNKSLSVALFLCVFAPNVFSEDHNITVRTNPTEPEQVSVETKYFCSTVSALDAEKQCQAWLKEQKGNPNMSSRVLFSSCSKGKDLSGQERHGCMSFLSEGEIKYLLNQKPRKP